MTAERQRLLQARERGLVTDDELTACGSTARCACWLNRERKW
jgi:hypothetical protein